MSRESKGVAPASPPPRCHPFGAEPVPVSGKAGIANARRVIRERFLRARHFPHMAEPAWLILLDLYANPARDVSVTSACGASFAPHTTALRYIDLLEAEGLVEREPDAGDRRKIWLRLTPWGACLLTDYFAAGER